MSNISDEGKTMGFQTRQIRVVIVGLRVILRHETSSLTQILICSAKTSHTF